MSFKMCIYNKTFEAKEVQRIFSEDLKIIMFEKH